MYEVSEEPLPTLPHPYYRSQADITLDSRIALLTPQSAAFLRSILMSAPVRHLRSVPGAVASAAAGGGREIPVVLEVDLDLARSGRRPTAKGLGKRHAAHCSDVLLSPSIYSDDEEIMTRDAIQLCLL
jgi:hypothetical protein